MDKMQIVHDLAILATSQRFVLPTDEKLANTPVDIVEMVNIYNSEVSRIAPLFAIEPSDLLTNT